VGYQIEGRERELIQLQRASVANNISYLHARAQEQLNRSSANDGVSAELADRHTRELRIQALSDTRGADGRESGRIAATRMIDAEIAKAKAEALVRGH
jgi:hypothetical protein